MDAFFTRSALVFPLSLTVLALLSISRPCEGSGSPPEPRVGPHAVDEIRAGIREGLETWQVPGLALGIVQGDTVVLAEGFGRRSVDDGLPVTEHTLFAIASATKPFTASSLGVLVDEGLLEWDRRVIDVLPWFRLADDHATTHVTVRDLLTHRTGVATHNFVWFGSPLGRRELLERVRYLPPSAGLRERFQYQNVLFTAAGYLGGVLAGGTWEELVRTRLFEPLGMESSGFSGEETAWSGEHAVPHGRGDDGVEVRELTSIEAVAPSGGIVSNVSDMLRWLRLNLGDGTFEGRRVLATSTLREIQAPQVVQAPHGEGPEVPYFLYGLGWNVFPYRGHRVVHHAGTTPSGFSSAVAVLPEDGLGVAILCNRRSTLVPLTLYTVLDRLLGLEPIDWTKRNARELEYETGPRRRQEAEPQGTAPPHAHPLEAYAGEYEHPAYGVVRVEPAPDELQLVFNRSSATLGHQRFEVFATLGRGPIGGLTLKFGTGISGDVETVAIPFDPTVEPIVFHRRAPRLDAATLASFAGRYQIPDGPVLVVRMRGDRLALELPGQPPYPLTMLQDSSFRLGELEGFTVRFVGSDGGRTLEIHEPDGVSKALRLP